MTFLRDEGRIKPTLPTCGSGKKHYKVEYELVAIIEGRNLRYEARFPPGRKVRRRAQVSIAAAFQPGIAQFAITRLHLTTGNKSFNYVYDHQSRVVIVIYVLVLI